MSAKKRRTGGSRKSKSTGFAWLPGALIGLLIIGGLSSGQITFPGMPEPEWPDFGIGGPPRDIPGIDPQLPDLGEILPDPQPSPDDGSGGEDEVPGDGGSSTEGLGQIGGLNVSYTPAQALAALDSIPVATSMATGYQRDHFGSGWGNVRGTGCDARNVVLARDLVDVTYREGTNNCVVLTGTLHGPYTGNTIAFERGQDTSRAVQIDHIVPAATAWRLGAHAWSEDRRREWFNDLDNLIAVDGPTNGSKGDSTLGEWQPPHHAERCDYAAQYIYVIDKYDLALIEQDVTYARQLLPTCS